MFFKYEKSLEEILKYYRENETTVMHSDELNIPMYQLIYLEAYELIKITPYVDGSSCRITLTNKGIVFFDSRREKWFRFWFPLIITNSLSFFALVIAVLAYIKQ